MSNTHSFIQHTPFPARISALQNKHPFASELVLLLLSSAAMCAVCLGLAVGYHSPRVFFAYFQNPLIFLLNYLPMLLLQALLLCLLGRQWLAFLLSSLFFTAASVGNYFKILIRNEPFIFSDLGSIAAALEISGNYDIGLDKRILAVLLALLLGTLILFLLRQHPGSRKGRLVWGLVLLFSLYPLFRFVYGSEELYREHSRNPVSGVEISDLWASDLFISRGFVYPFLYSIHTAIGSVPQGYTETEALSLLSRYEDSPLAPEQKVNLLVFQIEALKLVDELNPTAVSPDAFAAFRSLQAESLHGSLIPNVLAGTTIDSERCFLSGSYGLQNYSRDADSHVRWLNAQGYFTTGSHANWGGFYNRRAVNSHLGFQEFLFSDFFEAAGIGDSGLDRVFISSAVDRFLADIEQKKHVFSFNVTLQGHSPYVSDRYLYDQRLYNEDVEEELLYTVNNYLGSVYDTQQVLLEEVDRLRACPEPIVLVVYGDHCPSFTSVQSSFYAPDISTLEGFVNFYSTPYLIWANDAAKAVSGADFSGEGPTISPGYLLNVTFQELGWKGSPFLQLTSEILEQLPVVHALGYFVENGSYTLNPSEEAQERITDYRYAQYYMVNNAGDHK